MASKKTNNKMTKVLLTALFIIGFSPVVHPITFDKPFTQDLRIFIESQFNGAEKAFLANQEELYLALIKEVETHPDLIQALPIEVQAELSFWQKRGKSLN